MATSAASCRPFLRLRSFASPFCVWLLVLLCIVAGAFRLFASCRLLPPSLGSPVPMYDHWPHACTVDRVGGGSWGGVGGRERRWWASAFSFLSAVPSFVIRTRPLAELARPCVFRCWCTSSDCVLPSIPSFDTCSIILLRCSPVSSLGRAVGG